MEGSVLPSGMVTFAFSDIEGSTALLRRLGPAYDDVLRRCVDLLNEVWQAHGGHVGSEVGDSTFAVFSDALAAVNACAEGQRLLAAESWPRGGRPHVRMGVHTGLALPRGGGYVALALHQAVRVMTTANGSQILVSEQTAAEIGDAAGLELLDRGRYRVRDFDRPPRLFQVTGAGLSPVLAPIRAMPAEGHNLPRPSNPLVGREAELRHVLVHLAPGRVLTLLGTGGVGKTRLAVEAGIATAPAWEDGVWLVELAPIEDAALLGQAVADAVGAPGSNGSDRWRDALEHLAARKALLLLDNCEQLIVPLASRVLELLAACPGVAVLATSRERLAVAAERVLPIGSLAQPVEGASVAECVLMPAVDLLVQRARAVRPDFAVDEGNVTAVASICRRLDGLPLALELAASQLAHLTPASLLGGLEDRFTLLRTRERDRPDRQRTLEAAIDWSVRLLPPAERVALRRLAVFAKDFTIEAATPALADGEQILEGVVPELVWRLVESSLVAVDLTGSDSRYRMLESVREFARRMLHEHAEQGEVARRLADWWLLGLGPWQPMDRLKASEISEELENLRSLVPLLGPDHPELAQHVAGIIGRFYYAVTTPRHGVDELTGYAATLTEPSAARVSLLTTLADLHVRSGDIARAGVLASKASTEQELLGSHPPWDDVAVQRALGEVAIRSADYATAAALAQDALAGELTSRGRARMHNLLGLARHFAGDDVGAARAFQDELVLARALDDDHLAAIAEGNLAELSLRQGNLAVAASHQRACLELGLALGSPVQVAYSLITAAKLVVAEDPVAAVRLHARAEDILAENGHLLYDDDLATSEAMLTRARASLGTAYEQERDAGRSLALADAARAGREALERVALATAVRSGPVGGGARHD